MVLARTNDSVVEAISPRSRLRFIFADVSQTARRLARSHGYPTGPARLLGKALAGTAAASMDWTGPRDTLVADTACDGEAGGWHVEIDGVGHIRGCLHSTTFPPPPNDSGDDGHAESGVVVGPGRHKDKARTSPPPDPELDALCGNKALAKFTKFDTDGDIASQVSLEIKPGTPESVFSKLLGVALPTRLCLCATLYEGELDHVRALAMQTLPEAVPGEARRIERLFDDGTVYDTLGFDCTLATMRDVLGLDDLFTGPTQAVVFGCTCTREKVLQSFASRPSEVLAGLARSGRPQRFRCHLCGREWTVSAAELAEMPIQRPKGRE